MNCFNHTDLSSIGVCQACGKALCSECSSQRSNGIACKITCENRFDVVNPAINSVGHNRRPTSRQVKWSRVVVTMYSLVIVLGFVPMLFAESMTYGFCFLGLCLAVVSVIIYRRKRQGTMPIKGGANKYH
jgi:hypothetical protein